MTLIINLHKDKKYEYQKNNNINKIKSGLINQDIINIRYLEELLRIQYSIILPHEKVLILNKNKKNP